MLLRLWGEIRSGSKLAGNKEWLGVDPVTSSDERVHKRVRAETEMPAAFFDLVPLRLTTMISDDYLFASYHHLKGMFTHTLSTVPWTLRQAALRLRAHWRIRITSSVPVWNYSSVLGSPGTSSSWRST